MTLNTAVKKSIKHWEIMYQWAKRQPASDVVDSDKMSKSRIHQCWYDWDCALCGHVSANCDRCPLALLPGGSCETTNSLWARVERTDFWGEWCTAANDMIVALKKIDAVLEPH